MFLPMVNNQAVRGNNDTSVSAFGVDLNRNFEVGWQKSNPDDDTYSGPREQPVICHDQYKSYRSNLDQCIYRLYNIDSAKYDALVD